MSRSHRDRPPRSTKADAVLASWAAARDANRQALITRIEAAFDGVELGEGLSLHQGRALDDYEPPEVVADARADDTEERWQDISDEKVERLWDALGFLDAEGVRFYLPRYMVYAQRHYGRSSSPASDSALYHSDLRDSTGRHALLSPAQRQVVQAFAEFFDDNRAPSKSPGAGTPRP